MRKENILAEGKPDFIDSLIGRCRAGWALPGEFYSDETVYRADLDRIWRHGWLFAGHDCEIPDAGDYFLLEVAQDSIIVMRGDGGEIRSFHNVCRHRGSLLCTESA